MLHSSEFYYDLAERGAVSLLAWNQMLLSSHCTAPSPPPPPPLANWSMIVIRDPVMACTALTASGLGCVHTAWKSCDKGKQLLDLFLCSQ